MKPLRGVLALALIAIGSTVICDDGHANSLGAAQLIRPYSGQRIAGLRWKSRLSKVVLRPIQGSSRHYPHAVLIGHYQRPGWRVTWNNREIRTNPKGYFRLFVPLKKSRRTLRIIAIGPNGKIQMERDKVKYPGWIAWARAERKKNQNQRSVASYQEPQQEKQPPPQQREMTQEAQPEPYEQPEPTEPFRGGEKPFTFTPALGFDQVSFSDPRLASLQANGQNSFTQFATRLQIGGRAVVQPRTWDFEGDFYFQVASFGASSDKSAQFWGYHLNTGYVFNPKSLWRVKGIFGMWGNSMVVENSEFGYENVYGPEARLALIGDLGGGHQLHFEVGYGMVSNAPFSLLGTSNRNLKAKLGYELPYSSTNTMQIYLNYSDVAIELSNIPMSTTIFTLGFGFNF